MGLPKSAALATAAALLLLAWWAKAEDWPQWRGPHRDGIVTDFQAPKQWPAHLERVWNVPVGLGQSSPVLVGQSIYVFTRRGEKEVIACLNLADGSTRWEQSYSAPYEVNPAAVGAGPGPKSTPAVADGRVFTFGINGLLSCWDAKTGEKVWEHEFSKQFEKTSPVYGTATSPLVEEGKCIVYAGGPDRGALCAFDVETGKLMWGPDGDGPAYTSPVVVTISKVRQIVSQSQTACIGVALKDGTLLWKIPFRTEFDQNSITPVVFEDSIIFSGYNKGIVRYEIEKSDGDWQTNKVWEINEASLYMSTPVVSGDRLIGFSHRQKGQLFCIDLTSGQTLWTNDGRMGENAALVRSGEVLWALTTGSELIPFRDSAQKYEPLATYKVSETPTWAHPVILPDGALIKDESSLGRWALPKSP